MIYLKFKLKVKRNGTETLHMIHPGWDFGQRRKQSTRVTLHTRDGCTVLRSKRACGPCSYSLFLKELSKLVEGKEAAAEEKENDEEEEEDEKENKEKEGEKEKEKKKRRRWGRGGTHRSIRDRGQTWPSKPRLLTV